MSNSVLTFLGRGDAFNYLEDNTSAYLIHEDHLYLFDCGQKIATKIINLNLLDKIKNVTVFITHLHPDHVASLPELLTYIKVFLKDINIQVVYKNKDNILSLLRLLHYDFDVIILDSYQDDYLRIEIVNQTHVINSYGYIVYASDCSFFYSGDASTINEKALDLLIDDELDYFYHEVSEKDSSFHIGIETLNKNIPLNLRKKVYLMHFKDENIINLALENGYKVVEVE